MDVKEYTGIIESAKRLDRSLFDLSSEEKINKLEAILDTESKERGEVMLGIPLVPPYGMPIFEYILLSKRVYDKMRIAMQAWKIGDVHKVVGVPYDKERFDINKGQIRNNVDLLKLNRIPDDVIELMRNYPDRAKVKIYSPAPDFD